MKFNEVFSLLRNFNGLPPGDTSLVPPSLTNFSWNKDNLSFFEKAFAQLEIDPSDKRDVDYYEKKIKDMSLKDLTDEIYFLFYGNAERISDYTSERILICFKEIKGRVS